MEGSCPRPRCGRAKDYVTQGRFEYGRLGAREWAKTLYVFFTVSDRGRLLTPLRGSTR